MRALKQMRPLLAVILFSSGAFAQQPDPQVLAIFSGISQHAARIEPMIEQLKPNDWVEKGAPDTYVAQWNSVMQQLKAIQTDMSALVQHPEQMTECMKALFRVQASHQILNSLMGGLRRYQNPAMADLIESVSAEDQANIDRLEQYILQLAAEQEQQYAVVDNEAQRCRATLSRQPADNARTKTRTQ